MNYAKSDEGRIVRSNEGTYCRLAAPCGAHDPEWGRDKHGDLYDEHDENERKTYAT